MDDFDDDEDEPMMASIVRGGGVSGKLAAPTNAGNAAAGRAARSLPDAFKPGSDLRKSVLFQTAKFVEEETANLPGGVSSVSSETVAALSDLVVRYSAQMALGGLRFHRDTSCTARYRLS